MVIHKMKGREGGGRVVGDRRSMGDTPHTVVHVHLPQFYVTIVTMTRTQLLSMNQPQTLKHWYQLDLT